MDKKIMAFAIIAIVALVVAVVALGVAFTVLSESHPSTSSTPTPTSIQPTLTPSATTTIKPTAPFDSTLTSTYALNNTLIENGTKYAFSYTLNNPMTSANSSYPISPEIIITEVGKTTASTSDVKLSLVFADVITSGTILSPVPLTANGNQLINGINGTNFGFGIITSGFYTTVNMEIVFNATGTFNLGVNLVPSAS